MNQSAIPHPTDRLFVTRSRRVIAIATFWLIALSGISVGRAAEEAGSGTQETASSPPAVAMVEEKVKEIPWDFRPYQVLIWITSDRADLDAGAIAPSLELSLSRDFFSLWRVNTADAPPAVAAMVQRDMRDLSYDKLTASDSVLAIKKDHPQSARIRTLGNVVEFVETIYTNDFLKQGLTDEASPDQKAIAASLAAKMKRFPWLEQQTTNETPPVQESKEKPIELKDVKTLAKLWMHKDSEAILTTRGIASGLPEPDPRLLATPNDSLVSDLIDQYDKIFFIRLRRNRPVPDVTVTELDTLMRHFGAPARVELGHPSTDADNVVDAIIEAFRPVVRIESAGRKVVQGLTRAGGLIVDPQSPAKLQVGDILEPMVRKDDRKGNPISIGPLDWSFLVTSNNAGRLVEMDFWSGRAGGLQGRQNSRTFRMGLRVRPKGRSSELRLHAKGDATAPLIGYEIYDKELESGDMEFVGRTDWNGRLKIDPTDNPFRLLYVKNGGAVLARLPIVPGLHSHDVADLTGDDDRLQAEAYIKGVQNAIIDLVAIRELFKARVHMRLERGEFEKAEELMLGLKKQPSTGELSDQLDKRQKFFLESIKNPSQRKKVDNMFSTTRGLLEQFINAKLIQDLEKDMLQASKNGGKLKKKKPEKKKEGE